MPHFVIDCSSDILKSTSQSMVMEQVHSTVLATGLFAEGDIKVRLRPFEQFLVGNTKGSFIHVFGTMMEGRTTAQKSDLSRRIVQKLLSIYPDVPNIAANIQEFEKATYFNRNML